MILVLSPDTGPESPDYKQLLAYLANMPGISTRVRTEVGSEQMLTEVYLIGNTKALLVEDMQNLPCVEQVVRISEEYRVLGRHKDGRRSTYFDYNGVRFGQDTLNVFAGLCAVDTLEHVELMMQALRDNGQVCTRMGAYKPRTSPYSFQGHGKPHSSYSPTFCPSLDGTERFVGRPYLIVNREGGATALFDLETRTERELPSFPGFVPKLVQGSVVLGVLEGKGLATSIDGSAPRPLF